MEAFRSELNAATGARFPDAGNLVYGEGACSPRIMLIGEAPGAREAESGHPFVGKAGSNLDAYLARAGIRRSDVYITNTVKFRPCRRSAAGNLVNRPPSRMEIEFFLPYLLREIALVDPACIVTLGNVPLKALLGHSAQIGELHGHFIEWEQWALFPMYHPASLIYNPSLKAAYDADLHVLSQWLSTDNLTQVLR